MSHIHIHLENRRHVRDRNGNMTYWRGATKEEYRNCQIGQKYTFGGNVGGQHKGKVIGKKLGEISGAPMLLIEWDD